MNRRWPALAILIGTIALGFLHVRWADREFLRREPRGGAPHSASRPDWVWAWNHPYRRIQNDWIWACVAVTVGAGAVLAFDSETWRRPLPPGTIMIVAILLVVGVTALHSILAAPVIFWRNVFLAAPAIFWRNGAYYGLRDALLFRMPGVILGAWVVTWGRKSTWKGRLVAWLWLVNVGLLVGYGILFG